MVRGRVEEKEDILNDKTLSKNRCDKCELVETALDFITNAKDTLKEP